MKESKQRGAPPAASDEGLAARVERLERELASTRAELERTARELEAANEGRTSSDRFRTVKADLGASQAEVQAANASLTRVNALLDAVLDALPVGVVIAEPGGRIVRANRANQALWGGAPSSSLNDIDDFRAWVGHWPATGKRVEAREWAMARALSAGEYVAGELVEIERFDGGGRRLIINTASPVRDAAGQIVAGVVAQLDVTDRVRVEGQQRFLADLAAAIQPLTDPAETAATVARLLAEHLGADRCAYAEADGDDHFCIVGDFSRGVPSIVGRYALADFGADFARLTRADVPYVVSDVDADPRIDAGVREAYRQASIRAVISVAFRKHGRFAGGMAVHQTAPRAWRDDEVELVRIVAGRCWELLERARAMQRLQESEARYRAAAEALKEASNRKDEFLATLAHELRNPLAPIRNGLTVLRMAAEGEGARGGDGAREGDGGGEGEGGGDGDRGAVVAMMDRQLSQLVHLVDDLLDVSR
ncbi:MAG TPA: GAF domain-containing protein, partial [Polyangiaceae bacterium]|nr:GAF domain-containing protein [Polyangiaceae bacterium]